MSLKGTMPEFSHFSDVVFDLSASADPNPPKILYSRRDAAYTLSISIRALDYLIANGQLKTRPLGKKVMIAAAELQRFADEDHSHLTISPPVN